MLHRSEVILWRSISYVEDKKIAIRMAVRQQVSHSLLLTRIRPFGNLNSPF